MLHFELDPRLHDIFDCSILSRRLLQMLPPAWMRNDIVVTAELRVQR
jgi:hypothetical protein